MSQLLNALTVPVNPTKQKKHETTELSTTICTSQKSIPSHGNRQFWTPRTNDDFADGGAFPEIQTVQFPLEMGQKDKKKSNAVAIQLDAEGKIKYDVLARRGHHKDKIIFSKFTDLLPIEDDANLQKPSEEEVAEITEKTRLALQKITNGKITAAMPVRAADKRADAVYFRYTPSQPAGFENQKESKQRVIRMVEAQRDPMEPARFILNKKIPRGPPSPPAPVMHSPTRRITAKEQIAWKIPPCVSNWKNAKGYAVPLDKRLVADGRGLQQVHVNENFARVSEALYIADRKAREGIELRAQLEKQVACKEKERKENNLRELAQKARDERAGLKSLRPEVDGEAVERDQLRNERRNERQRDRNLQRAAPEKRSRLQRQRERDVSEMIALGVPNPGNGASGLQYDDRLFNQNRGIGSGFGGEDSYNVYDKPWRAAIKQSIYRPSKDLRDDEESMEMLVKKKFVPDKGFAGTDRTDRSSGRTGPVQFEKVDEDPFGLDKFLTDAKKSEKRGSDHRDNSREKRHRKY